MLIGALRRTLELVCVAAAFTGLTALVLGVWAWRNSLPGAAIAVAASLPTIVVAVYVIVRSRALARAVSRPTETFSQAKDLVARAKGSPELHQVARRVASGGRRSQPGVGRIRRAVRSGQAISAVIGLADPDPQRHDLLIPFTPVRLRMLWLAITVGLWCWLVSAVMASIAFLSLAIQAF